MRPAVLFTLMFASVLSGCAPRANATAPSPAALDLDGRDVRPLDDAGPLAHVLVFVRTDCPIANRYAPEIQRLAALAAPRGVAFALVYVDPKEDAARIRQHLAEFGYKIPALRDPQHHLVDLAQVNVTPSVALFRRDRTLAYAGRIDDRVADFGKQRAAPDQRDLENAIDAVVDGRTIAVARTVAVGCDIASIR